MTKKDFWGRARANGPALPQSPLPTRISVWEGGLRPTSQARKNWWHQHLPSGHMESAMSSQITNKERNIEVNSWDNCQNVFKKLEGYRRSLQENNRPYIISPFLFRGHGNANWTLKTTLDRYNQNKIFMYEYYMIIEKIKPEIESFTNKSWILKEYEEPKDTFMIAKLPNIDYLIYLRHYGFPSPLLDWTRSFYIAAFFAFNNIPYFTEKVAIYAFLEWGPEGKTHLRGEPIVSTCRTNVKTDKRHFLQQCEYTLCTNIEEGKHYFASHETVLSNNQNLWKIIVPSTERFKALSHLDSMNINASSLFGSEESLMETLALREFHLTELKYLIF